MLTELERRGLKSVASVAVKEAGGQENCAAISGRIKRAAAFSDYANPQLRERHIPLDVAVEIDRFNKNRRLIRAAAELLGCRLTSIQRAGLGTSTAEALCAVVKEGGEAMAAIAPFLERDLRPSPAQREHAIKQIDEAIEALLEGRARLAPPPTDEANE